MKSIHIGIDAFRLIGPQTSIGTYTNELIAALLPLGFRITLYAPRREDGSDLSRYEGSDSPCDVVYAPTPSQPEKLLGDLFRWNQRILPMMLRRDPCEVFIAPYQQVPCFTPDRIPTLVVIHDLCGLRPDCGYRFFGKAWFRHFWNLLTAACCASRIVPISMATREEMLRKFPFCRKRISAPIYNQVTGKTTMLAEAEKIIEPFSIPNRDFILAFGITGPRKALDVALAGYASYRNTGGSLPLVLMGVDNETAVRRHIPNAWADDIKLLPRVSACERDALYRLATCLLFCSRCEGFGYPIVEAMRQGCPVVAAASTPASEITDGLLKLMRQLEATECASLIQHYAEMDQASRIALGISLIDQSARYSNASFGTDFQNEIRLLAGR